MRLRTWRDKPEKPQPASRGGLKKTPQTGNGEALSPSAALSLPSTAATTGHGDIPPSLSDTTAGGPVGEGDAEGASTTLKSSREGGEGKGRGTPVGKSKSPVEMGGEDELRESLLATRQAEVKKCVLFADDDDQILVLLCCDKRGTVYVSKLARCVNKGRRHLSLVRLPAKIESLRLVYCSSERWGTNFVASYLPASALKEMGIWRPLFSAAPISFSSRRNCCHLRANTQMHARTRLNGVAEVRGKSHVSTNLSVHNTK